MDQILVLAAGILSASFHLSPFITDANINKLIEFECKSQVMSLQVLIVFSWLFSWLIYLLLSFVNDTVH